jgi:hypothetical protein
MEYLTQKKSMPDIQTLKLPKASRTYFFDIAKTTNKGFYLRISCSEKNRLGFEHHRLFIFEEDLSSFVAALKKSAEALEQLKKKGARRFKV